jgi:hypothetical protein
MKVGEAKNGETNPWAEFSKNIAKYQTPDVWKSIWQIVKYIYSIRWFVGT